MSFFQQLGILAALEEAQKKEEQKKIDDAYKPLIRLANLIDKISAWLRK